MKFSTEEVKIFWKTCDSKKLFKQDYGNKHQKNIRFFGPE